MKERWSPRHVVQLAVVVLFGWAVGQLLQQTTPIGQDMSDNQTAAALLQDNGAPSLEVKAPTLTLIIFTDYQCSACKLAHAEMERAVASDGHVRIVYKDLPIFGILSERAARVAIAVDRQGIYPEVHRGLMEERRQLNEQILRDVVEQAGGDWTRLQQDLRVHGVAIDRQVDINRRDAFKLGIVGTPAYLAGQTLVSGAIDEAGFAKAFVQGRKTANK